MAIPSDLRLSSDQELQQHIIFSVSFVFAVTYLDNK